MGDTARYTALLSEEIGRTVSVLGTVYLSYGFAENVEAGKGLSDLGPRAATAFAVIFLIAGIGLVIANVFLLLMEEKPLRSTLK